MNSKERNDLIISWLTISAAFAIVLSGLTIRGLGRLDISALIRNLPIALVAVGTGFILHEMAHRQVARHFGAHAEYRAWPHTLLLTIASAFMGFVFAAPGAVYIHGPNITIKENGMISVAGPLTNIILAIIFFLFGIFSFMFIGSPFLFEMAFISMFINVFLATFNLLPIWQLDGAKVMAWNAVVWGILFVPSLLIILFFWM